MKRPDPASGMVVRYDYLWEAEHARGRREGAKVRPCAIVIARTLRAGAAPSVALVPITHSPPQSGEVAIEIPDAVRAQLGLDSDRQWIVNSEINIAAWDDAGFVPVSKSRWDYGLLPPSLANRVNEWVVKKFAARKLPAVSRDPAFRPRPA